MIVVAREALGITQSELARRLSTSQANMSKYESGLMDVSEEHLEKLSIILGFPKNFFYLTEPIYPYGSSCVYHRKRQTIPVSIFKQLLAKFNITRIQLKMLLRGVELESPNKFFRMDLEEYENSPEKIARMIRHAWHVPSGPIGNLVGLVEAAGGLIIRFNFENRKLDAFSQWLPDVPPIFFVNSEIPTDRCRFTLCHEIGHLIMHQVPTPNMEREADRFASEFLMPSKEIAPELFKLSLPRLAQLKLYWKVAMSALIKRASDLGKISPRHYRSLITQLSKLGYRMREPIEIPEEQPYTIQKIIDTYKSKSGLTIEDLSKITFCSSEARFSEKFGPRQKKLAIIS